MAPVIPIGPGPESVAISIYAAGPAGARWDRATWDGAPWSSPAWQSVGCEVGEAVAKWGASEEAGILSTAAAGEVDLNTIDPDRVLDPLNTASPFYGAVKPGTPVRVVGLVPAEKIVATGYIDSASYDLASGKGRIRALDGIAYLSQAQVPDATVLPNTLRARVRAVVAAVGLSAIVPVEPEPGSVRAECMVNGGFEQGLGSWQLAPNGGSIVTLPTPYAPQGGNIAAIRGAAAAGFALMYQDVPVMPGGTYTLSGYIGKFGSDPLAGTLRADVLPASTTVITLVASAPSYSYVSGSYTVPADGSVTALRIYCYGSSPSPATQDTQFDAISLIGPPGGSAAAPLADPPVAPHDGKSAPAWQIIANAALDALWYVWLDPTGTLRFRSWGSLPDAPLSIGCPPDDADPGEQWLSGIATLETTASGDAIRNSVRAYSSGTIWAPAITDGVSIGRYGPRPFDIERVVPDRATWAARILADRADAGLELGAGDVRPYNQLELGALLDLGLGGPSIIRIRDDEHGELVDLDTGMIGATIGITPAGWRWALVTLISRVEWDAIDPEPPVPPIPPPDPWHVETRTYIATSDALLALTSGGANYGAGASSSLPVGAWQGWTYRSCIRFPALPWTKVRAVRSATLKLRASTQVRVGFGSSPKTQIRRITEDWSAGSSSSPSGSNAVVWPGPATTTSGAVTAALPKVQSADAAIRVDALIRAWAPTSAGGSGAKQYGLELREASSSGSNTAEVWPVEQGGTARPTLELVVEVFD